MALVLPAAALVCVLALLAPSGAAAAFAQRTLAEGAKGPDVAKVQRLLVKLGEPLDPDGAFGPMTAAAVRRFEVSRALTVDGSLTAAEQRALRAAARRLVAEQRAAQATAATGGVDPAAALDPEEPADPAPTATATATATLNADGTATPPPGAPPAVAAILAAGNEIASKPYKYGGGHAKLVDHGYDCSGSVSYALRGAGLMTGALPSGAFETWGAAGPGRWVTIYANKTHMFMIVAGLRFDTSGAKPSRWQTAARGMDGFVVRHPDGL